MVRIRLRRVGATKQPAYRIVVTDRRNPRDGRFIEKIGYYNPRTEPATLGVDEARAYHWLGNGAQPSEAVARIFKNLGTLDRFERLRAGEPLEELLEEAEAAAAARPEVDPRTRRDDLEPGDYKTQTATPTATTSDVDTEAEAEVDETEEMEEVEEETEEEAADEAEESDDEAEESDEAEDAETDSAEEEEEDDDDDEDSEEESDKEED